MGQYKFNLYAYAGTPAGTQAIDIHSLGGWEQIIVGKSYEYEKLTSLKTFFGQASGGSRKKAVPLNFEWTPWDGKIPAGADRKAYTREFIRDGVAMHRRLFRAALRKGKSTTIELRIQPQSDDGNRMQTMFWNFYDVEVMRVQPKGKRETVSAVFYYFDTGSNQP
jgi:hypothetical protein